MRVIIAIIISVFSFGYFIPGSIAFARRRSNTAAIFALNFFLGWTVLGWVVALVWSLMEDNKKTIQPT